MTNEHINTLIVCAVRYCFGRQSYMPDLVREIITENLDILTKETLDVLIRDIEDYKRNNQYRCDFPDIQEVWDKLLNTLIKKSEDLKNFLGGR